MKRIITLLLFLCLLPMAAMAEEALTGYQEIARTDQLVLFFHEKDKLIAVQELAGGDVFYQAVPQSVLSRDGLTKALKEKLDSPFTVTYAMLNQNDTSRHEKTILAMEPEIGYTLIEGGILLTYVVEDLFLEIDMKVTIQGDSMRVEIPAEGIREAVGSTQVVEKRMSSITAYVDAVTAALEAVRNDEALQQKTFRKELKNAITQYENLSYIISQITDAIGIEYMVDELMTSITRLDNALNGGEGQSGLFPAILKSVSDEAQQAGVQALRDEVNNKKRMASMQSGTLKKIKVAGVISIDLLPMFGAGGDQEEGYAFYPDGSGALCCFKSQHPAYNEAYGRKVWSDDTVDLKWDEQRDSTGQQRILLPVFGMKKGNSAYVAAVTKGAAESTIHFNPSGYQVNVNRASASFDYRRSIRSASIVSFYQGAAMNIYDKQRYAYDAEVTYFFLSGDQADYSGMANRYREYLISQGLLKQNEDLGSQGGLVLDVLNGIKQPMFLFEQYINATTFDQVQQMLDDLQSRGVEVGTLNLHGWTTGGYGDYPTTSEAARSLGGMSGLKELAERAGAQEIHLYLQDNYTESDSLLSSVSGMNLAQETDHSVIEKLFSPATVPQRFASLMEKLAEVPVSGISFDRIGGFICYDYNPANPSQRTDTVDSWVQMYQQAVEIYGGAASVQGNQYVLPWVDLVMNVPSRATGYSYQDESVPFYQMVLHGSVAYTGKAFNTFYDPAQELLTAVEGGYAPLYRLTWISTQELRDAEYELVFSSAYADWTEEIAATANRLEPLRVLRDKKMLHHQRQGDLAIIRYEGGYTLYVNYGMEPVALEDGEIPAEDFLLTRKGDGQEW